MSTLAIILAGGSGTSLGVLAHNRAQSAMPFAGKYRIIDFTLSNCANSGILNLGILTQYHPHSLNNHIRNGRPWDLDRTWSGSVTLLPPYRRGDGAGNWYGGTADAVYQNLDFVLEHEADTVLLLPGEHVYKMDYRPVLHYHQELEADVTICVSSATPAKRARDDYLVSDGEGRVVGIQDTPLLSPHSWVSMGIYIFRTEVLRNRLAQDARSFTSTHDLARDVLPRMLELGDRIHAFPTTDYWVHVNTVQAYWQAHMDLLQADPPLKLLDGDWRIRTRSEERPPVAVFRGANVANSLITNGCRIHGRVENSVLSPGVFVGEGAVVRDSIVMSDCEIGPQAVVDRAILDKNVIVGEQAFVGYFPNPVRDNGRVKNLDPGVTLIGRDTHLPAGFCVDANCAVCSDHTANTAVSDITTGLQRSGLRYSQIITDHTVAQQRQNAWQGVNPGRPS